MHLSWVEVPVRNVNSRKKDLHLTFKMVK